MTSDERINKSEFDALFNQMLKIVPPLKSPIKGDKPTSDHEQLKVEKLLVKLANIKPVSVTAASIMSEHSVPKSA